MAQRLLPTLFALLAIALLAAACDRGDDTATTQAPAEPGAAADEAAPAAEEAAPAAAGTTLAADFSPNPMTLNGTAGGPRDGSTWTGTAPHTDCTGYMPAEAQHTLTLSSAIENLMIVADANVDLTMAIEGPGGTWCNDDFQGLNPGLMGNWPAGTYQVFVGVYSEGVQAPYTLTLERIEAQPTTTHSLAPGFLPDPYTANGVAAGPRPGSDWTGTGEETHCFGSYPAEPQHILELQAFDDLQIAANATEGGDLTMVIEGPAGTWCNDDFQGLDPGFRKAFPAGTYRVFVGSLRGTPHPYTLNVTELF